MNQYLSRAVRGAVLASTLALPFAAPAAEDGASRTVDTIDGRRVDNLFGEIYSAALSPAGVRPGLPRTACLGLAYRL